MFFDILSSINNPNQQGSIAQLESLTNMIQHAGADRGIPSSQLQSVMSALGGFLGPALKQQTLSGGTNHLESMLGQLSGAGASAAALQSFLPPQLQQQIIQGLAQKTGISPNTLQGMLPSLIPAVMGLLNMGASKSGTGGNAILNAFLNNGGGNDLGDVLKFANRFLNPPQA